MIYSFIFFFFLSFIIISMTGERVAFIKFSIFIVLLLLYIFFKNKEIKKIKILISLLILIFSTYIIILFKTDYLDRHSQFIDKFKPGTNDFILYTGYYAHFTTALNIFSEKPILGSGFRSFRKECKKYENYFDMNNIPALNDISNEETKIQIKDSLNRNICTTHPHNFYLEILAETGMFGLILFLSILYLAYQKLIFFETKLFLLFIFFLLYQLVVYFMEKIVSYLYLYCYHSY